MASGYASNGTPISLSITVAGEFRPASPERTRKETIALLLAVLFALLLHAAVILSLVEWSGAERALPPPPIPVELIMEEPPAPPSPPAREQAPPPIPPPARLQSGDDSGTAPGHQPTPAETPTPAPAEPSSADQPTAPADLGDIPPPTPKPPVPKAQTAPAPPATPKVPPSANPSLGEGGGDAYLNSIRDRILSFRYYPAVAGPLQLSGTAIYEITLERSGQVDAVRLLRSTGVGTLDDIGFTMIRRAAPFAAVPPYIPGDPIRMVLQLNIGPK